MGEIIGRFHPLIVHLPIGMLILAFILELASRKAKFAHLQTAMPFILLVTIASAILAWFTGWIMPKEGDFDERLVSLHFWFALAVTFGTILLYFLHQRKDTNLGKYYFPLFVLNMLLLTLAGHFGGSLTHGEDFLTKAKTDSTEQTVLDVNTLLAYEDIIEPILKKNCYSCHNEGKKKGGLIMTTLADLETGGDEGPVLIKGNAQKSPLINRLHLPIEDEKHMPPKGKRAPNENEVKLLEWWIDNGAKTDTRIGDIEKSEEISKILKGYETSTSQLNTKGLTSIEPEQINKLKEKGITVYPESAESLFASASFSRDQNLKKSKINKLKSIAKNITGIDLSFTNMDDGMMSALASFTNLQKIKLQKTNVTSKGLKHLAKLEHLKSVNLYGTKVDDSAFENLRKLPSLTSLYLWQTEVSEDSLKAFSLHKPRVVISHNIDVSVFGDARLKPPLISAEKEIFKDTLRVNLSLNFKNVDVRYTTDGSIPDSTSQKYEEAFLIDKTAVIKAISIKSGWMTSEIAEAVYTKVGHQIASIQLQKGPSEKYKARGAKSLYDFEKGSTSFVDGKWLGYEGEHMIATIDLGETKSVNSVVVSALENTASYIFFPKGIQLEKSEDGKSFEKAGKLDIPIPDGPNEPSIKSFLLNLPNIETRYLKLIVNGTLKNPNWHAAPGAKNWIFIDEVLIN